MTTGQDGQITFFVDRCLGKLVVKTLRDTGISVEAHDDHFPKNALDVDWLPEVGKHQWVIITKDARIGRNQTERLAVTNARVKMFTLASQNLIGREMANIFLQSITKMQEFVYKHYAPFIAKVYRNQKVEMWKDASTLLKEARNFNI
ncbi:MAG: hypothetical protein AAGE96_03480 [Cyanobacteria bacterium P01_G01_bin.19]